MFKLVFISSFCGRRYFHISILISAGREASFPILLVAIWNGVLEKRYCEVWAKGFVICASFLA